MPGIARVGMDFGMGTCPCHKSPVSYITTFVSGSNSVTADGAPCVTTGSVGVSTCGHTTIALSGSGLVTAEGKGVHRVGDMGANCGTYIVVSGSPIVDSI